MKKKVINCLLVLLVIVVAVSVSAEENRKKYTGKGVKLKGETEWTSSSSLSSSPFTKVPKPLVRKKSVKKKN